MVRLSRFVLLKITRAGTPTSRTKSELNALSPQFARDHGRTREWTDADGGTGPLQDVTSRLSARDMQKRFSERIS